MPILKIIEQIPNVFLGHFSQAENYRGHAIAVTDKFPNTIKHRKIRSYSIPTKLILNPRS